MKVARTTQAAEVGVVLLAVLVGLAAAGEPLLLGRDWFLRDLLMHFLPVKELQASLLAHGQMPWWDPWRHGGQPLLASPNTVSLHPAVLPYLLLPTSVALGLTVAACTAASMLAMDRLARRLGGRAADGALAALAFGTSGVLASCVNLQPLFLGVCAVPPLVLFLDEHLRSGSLRALALAMLCGAWIALAGQPEAALVAAFTGLTWSVIRPANASLARRLGGLVAVGAGTLAIAAVQVIPAVHLLADSARGAGLARDVALSWSVNPRRLPELMVPGFLGSVDEMDPGALWSAGIEMPPFPYLVSLHLGAVPLLLALAGACGKPDAKAPRRLRNGLAGLAIAALAVALGRHLPGFTLLDHPLPVRFPVKAACALLVPVALLAALGVAEMRAGSLAARRVSAIAAALVIAFGVATAACQWATPGTLRAIEWWFEMEAPQAARRLVPAFGVATLQAGVVALLPALLRFRAGVFALHAVVLATGLHVFWAVNPAAPPEALRGVPPAASIALEALGTTGGRLYADAGEERFRIAAPANERYYLDRWLLARLSEAYAARYDIPVVLHDDFDGLVPVALAEYVKTTSAAAWRARTALAASAGAALVGTTAAVDGDGLALLAEVPTGGNSPLRLFRVNDAVPPVRFVSRSVAARDLANALQLVARPGRNPRDEVVLTGGPEFASDPPCTALVVPSSLGTAADWTGTLDAPCAGFVVLARPPHAGTRVTLDGREVPLLPADAAFLAIAVTPGHHVISWRYRPPGFATGAGISMGALAAVLLLLAFGAAPRSQAVRAGGAHGPSSCSPDAVLEEPTG